MPSTSAPGASWVDAHDRFPFVPPKNICQSHVLLCSPLSLSLSLLPSLSLAMTPAPLVIWEPHGGLPRRLSHHLFRAEERLVLGVQGDGWRGRHRPPQRERRYMSESRPRSRLVSLHGPSGTALCERWDIIRAFLETMRSQHGIDSVTGWVMCRL